MKVLITGGAGFIGSHLAERLLKEGFAVMVLDNLHTGRRENVPQGAGVIEMDVRDRGIAPLFAKECFDAVVHLAGQTMVNVSVEDPFFDESVNIHGTVNVLEACRKSHVSRVVFASSAAVYGDAAVLPVREEAGVKPSSFYGLSKLTVEKYLQMYHGLYGLEYAALRFANVYGERQGDGGEGGVISIFVKRAAEKKGIQIFGDGTQTRDFIYVGDIAEGICQALKADKVNDVYNLSTNQEVSVAQMVDLLREVSGGELQVAYGAPRPGDIYRSVLSNQKAGSQLNWHPGTSLKEGLERTYSYFKR